MTKKIKWSYYEIEEEEVGVYNSKGEKVDTIYLDCLIEDFLNSDEGVEYEKEE
jgi:hypothetical protein